MFRTLLLLSVAALGSADALAQSVDAPVPGVAFQQVTELDFEELELRAAIEGPSGRVFHEPSRPAFVPLFKLRVDFDPEVERSVDTVK